MGKGLKHQIGDQLKGVRTNRHGDIYKDVPCLRCGKLIDVTRQPHGFLHVGNKHTRPPTPDCEKDPLRLGDLLGPLAAPASAPTAG